ncbi:odorant receptor Or2-like [Pseudomyrmex gracilis]|uniref:odorant receptor Or2-like n=1 Tax=Pseudomyrmex gracilis TaxID=219809 RepID=UPI000994C118|nr:odorant receptor Or2-like [Pseudomyrmex gracilis]
MTRKSTIDRKLFFLLPFFGIWSSNTCIFISRVFWLVSLAFVEFCHCRYFVKHFNPDDFINLIDCMSSFLAYGKTYIKLIVLWINQKKFMETLELIANDWSDCANSDLHLMTRKAKISDRITNIILVLHTSSIVAYCLGVIVADADVTDKTTALPFGSKMDFYYTTNTQNVYRSILIVEFIHMICCNLVIGIVNAVLVTLVLHASGQIDLLLNWLTKLSPKNIENNQEIIATTTSKIIVQHQKIIQFSENIESLFTHITLFIFASNTLLICSIGFLIVMTIGTPNAIVNIAKCVMFLIITNLEAFMLCYAGEYLNNKSQAIGFATYSCAWYSLKPKDSRILLFIIMRSQKQMMLTAGKMMDLSLQSFTSIMNASGSYLSVLLAMQ